MHLSKRTNQGDFLTDTSNAGAPAGRLFSVASLVLIIAAGLGGFAGHGTRSPATSSDWEQPKRLATGSMTGFGVAVNAIGDVAAVWVSTRSGQPGEAAALYVALRESGSNRWRSQRVSAAPHGIGGPMVAMHPQSEAVVVAWSEAGRIYAVTGTIRGAWGQPRLVGRGSLGDIGVDGSGVATILWSGGGRWSRNNLLTSSGTIGLNSWSAPRRVPIPAGNTLFFQFEVGAGGDSLVTWTRCIPGERRACHYNRTSYFESSARATPQSRWSRPQLIATGDWDWDYVGAAIDGNGYSTAIWIRAGSTLEAATRARGGRWRYDGRISEPSDFDELNGGSYASLRIDAAGNRLVIWGAFSADKTVPDVFSLRAARRRPSDSRWQRSTLLDWTRKLAPGSISPAGIAVHSSGKAVATWFVGDTLLAELGDLSSDQWLPPTTLAHFPEEDAPGVGVVGAANAAGDAAVLWTDGSLDAEALWIAVFDRNGGG